MILFITFRLAAQLMPLPKKVHCYYVDGHDRFMSGLTANGWKYGPASLPANICYSRVMRYIIKNRSELRSGPRVSVACLASNRRIEIRWSPKGSG
jgi:hypothetical protein